MKRYILFALLVFFYNNIISQDVTLPFIEDFESATVGDPGILPSDWLQVNEGSFDLCTGGGSTYSTCYQWGVNSGSTASSNTGPSGDNTTGAGKYLFVEASGNANPEVLLLSPTFDLEGITGSLTFWAHSYSSNTGMSRNLYIDILNSSGTVIGNQILTVPTSFSINSWREWSVSLDPYASSGVIQVRFRWDDGSDDWRPDVAIDDVLIESDNEVCDNGTDDDGDGLVDCLDADCDNFIDCDNDLDNIADRVDHDDDNDGIPDSHECYTFSNLINNAGFESGNTGFSSDYSFQTCTTDCGPSRDVDRGEYGIVDRACGCGAQAGGVQELTGTPIEGNSFMVIDMDVAGDVLWSQTVSTIAYTEYSFNAWVLNISFSDEIDPRISLGISTNGGASYSLIGTSDDISEVQGWTLIGFNYINENNTSLTIAIISDNGGSTGREIAIDALSFIAADCDDDGDGVFNRFDLDSDNDGIYDTYESSSGATQSNGVLTGGVDSDGIPSSVSNSEGSIDYQLADSDGDGLLDEIELDSDDDGCFDSFEENIEDLDNDGISGTGIPAVNSDGLVTSITYTAPTLNSWQNPDEDNPACDGDSDDDGVPDVDDLDDDNDGIPDIIESPATIDFSGTKTLLVGSDLTNMLVGDVVLYEDAIRDCDDIFYDITITINSITAGATVEADPQGMLIKNAAAFEDDHFTFTLRVVENASADSLNVTGTPATIEDFLFKPRDIDSNVGIDHTEVFGISNSTLPDTIYLDPLTVLEEGGFINGLGPGPGYTYFRMIPVPNPGVENWNDNDNDTSGELDEFAVFMFYSNFSSVQIAYGRTGSAPSNSGGTRLTSLFASKECDRDGDGVPNRVDLDLDNDGIYDLYEAGHSFIDDIDGDGMIDGSDTGSGLNGLYDGIETPSENGNANYTYSDSDSDSLYDFFESDSDDDNCFDTEEADIADADVDGIAGTGPPFSDAFGRVTSITYEEPPTMNWQDPLQSCLEICDNGIDDDGDGLIDDFDTDCADYFLEAECGFPGANWVRSFDEDASNNDFQTITSGLNSLDDPPIASADILRFTVTILATGTYRILGRVKSASGADDSFWFRVDEGIWYKWNDWDTAGNWEWLEFTDNDNGNNPVRYILGIGSHSIDIAYREDGAGIDKLHLTINGSTPAGEGESAINCERAITTNLFLNYKIKNRTN